MMMMKSKSDDNFSDNEEEKEGYKQKFLSYDNDEIIKNEGNNASHNNN